MIDAPYKVICMINHALDIWKQITFEIVIIQFFDKKMRVKRDLLQTSDVEQYCEESCQYHENIVKRKQRNFSKK